MNNIFQVSKKLKVINYKLKYLNNYSFKCLNDSVVYLYHMSNTQNKWK